jgi:hypothetical protein
MITSSTVTRGEITGVLSHPSANSHIEEISLVSRVENNETGSTHPGLFIETKDLGTKKQEPVLNDVQSDSLQIPDFVSPHCARTSIESSRSSLDSLEGIREIQMRYASIFSGSSTSASSKSDLIYLIYFFIALTYFFLEPLQ